MSSKITVRVVGSSSQAKSEPASKPIKRLNEIVISPADVARLLREIDTLNENAERVKAAKTKAAAVATPRASDMLKIIADHQDLSLRKAVDRKQLQKMLEEVQAAPTARFIFAATPSEESLRQLAGWFRKNIHPHTLVDFTVRPDILMGCMVKIGNKLFDFSGTRTVEASRATLIKSLKETTR